MFLLDGAEDRAEDAAESAAAGEPGRPSVVFSASDLVVAASCEYAVLRRLDGRLGRAALVPAPADPMLERTARLGDAHERQVLEEFRARFGTFRPGTPGGVAEIPPAWTRVRSTLVQAHDATLAAMRDGADVVYQGSFFDGRFHGRADFLVREANGAYAVHDTKLARRAKVEALLQLAAYADQLERAGFRVADAVHLILGDGSRVAHRTHDLVPLYRERRARLEQLVERHVGADRPVGWDDADLTVCGRCVDCADQATGTRDVLLVAGLRGSQRAALRARGVRTVEDLAAVTGPVPGIADGTLAALRAQAALQAGEDATGRTGFEVFDPAALAALPHPDPGDLFFDFEGDPLWADGSGPASRDWGLEYLFGIAEGDEPDHPRHVTFWAHDRDQERAALRDFLDYVALRRERFPRMHVYHYAAYEKSALLRLAARHAEGEAEVDDLLREGLLVDLYPVVRSALRTSRPGYGLKDLELFFRTGSRSGAVTTAGDSIVEYATACRLRDAGDDEGWQERLDAIARYNAEDCVSTLRLRDWLLRLADAHGVQPGGTPDERADVPGPSEADPDEELLRIRLSLAAGPADPARRTPDQQAAALVAAALGYHRREDKPAWWAHFDRLAAPLEDWTDTRNTLRPTRVEQITPWRLPSTRATSLRRRLRLWGALEEGTELRPGSVVRTLYDEPIPEPAKRALACRRGWIEGAVVTAVSDPAEAEPWVEIEERAPAHAPGWSPCPVALGPDGPLQTQLQRAALHRLGEAVAQALELPGPVVWPANPALDLCRRVPPRLVGGRDLPSPTLVEDDIATVTAAIRSLDRSYLAVQGPPGTGKTHLGGHVIASLVADGWRVGVVAQSHAVVENLLRSAARAGVPAEAIGKKVPAGVKRAPSATVTGPGAGAAQDAGWAWLDGQKEVAAFQRRRLGLGWLFGGTTWDFANPQRFPDGSLDLLVIDEAGQFSLANTLAVSWPARRMLLLGDPQQLPQVSQGTHPEPVDASALEWLAEGHETLPPDRGYFLERTWRMHPELARAVSRLSYEDRLRSVPGTARRLLDGVRPGVHVVPVEHRERSVASPEEAAVVLDLVRDLLGRSWTAAEGTAPRPLTEQDLLVVAAYNAQVGLISRVLGDAGFGGVPVGTVDRFQGREAAVVIVSTAASSAEEVPRGAAFLLSRNRINVAVSRGQWAAFVVRSQGLTSHVPVRTSELGDLGAFIGLCAATPVVDGVDGVDGDTLAAGGRA